MWGKTRKGLAWGEERKVYGKINTYNVSKRWGRRERYKRKEQEEKDDVSTFFSSRKVGEGRERGCKITRKTKPRP